MKISPVSNHHIIPVIRSFDKSREKSTILGNAAISQELTTPRKVPEDEVNFGSRSANSFIYPAYNSSIKTIAELRESISSYIALAEKLRASGDTDEAQKIARNASYLSSKLSEGGIVTDPLRSQKYFVDLGRLKGGGNQPSSASETRCFKPQNLCTKGDFSRVEREINYLAEQRYESRMAKIYILNNSKYPLEYITCGERHGYFFSDVNNAFALESTDICGTVIKNTIPQKGGVGGILATKRNSAFRGCCGYFSFRVKTEGRNFIVCCGFNNPDNGSSSTGIVIRAEDGVTDRNGCITGHGVDPTGNVVDIHELINKNIHSTHDSTWHRTDEACRAFEVICEYTDKTSSIFRFTINSRLLTSNN